MKGMKVLKKRGKTLYAATLFLSDKGGGGQLVG